MQADLELVRRASSASCESEITDLEWQTALNDITDLEWQTALNDGSFRSAKESLSPAANPRLPFRLQRAERNPGSPEDAQQQHDSSALARPPVVFAEADTVFASPEGCQPYLAPPTPTAAPEPVSANVMSLVPHVLMFTQRPYDFLEQKIESYKRKLVKQSLGVVFHSSSPLDILLHRRFVALIFLLIAAVQLFFTIHAVMQTVNPVVGTAFRFTPLELRSGSTDPSHPQIAGFSVFANEGGCLTAVEPETCYTEDKHHYCRFQSETRLDAFAVITGGPIEHDPVRFELSRQSEDGDWDVVSYQQNWIAFSGAKRPGRPVDLPDFRGDAHMFDLRVTQNIPDRKSVV